MCTQSSDVIEAYLYLDKLKYLPVSDSKDITDIRDKCTSMNLKIASRSCRIIYTANQDRS